MTEHEWEYGMKNDQGVVMWVCTHDGCSAYTMTLGKEPTENNAVAYRRL